MSTQLDFAAIFQSYIDANKKVWAHDRTQTVGASEAFACIRQVWFKKVGGQYGFEADVSDDEPDWGATERGNILEEHHVVPAVRDHLPGTAKLLLAGNQQKTLFQGKNSATPDGVIVGLTKDALKVYGIEDIGSDCIMFEIKSVDPRVRLDSEKDIHRGQTQVQMGLVRATTMFRPNFAVILYVDASFLSKMKVFVVPYDEDAWESAKVRANMVYTTTNPIELQAEGKIDNACTFCDFKRACAMVTTGNIPDDNSKQVDDAIRERLQPFLDDYRSLQKAAKTSAHDFEVVKASLKAELLDIGTKKASAKGLWNVSWYGQKGQRTLDRAAVAEAFGIEDWDPFLKEGDPFDVMRVTFTD